MTSKGRKDQGGPVLGRKASPTIKVPKTGLTLIRQGLFKYVACEAEFFGNFEPNPLIGKQTEESNPKELIEKR